MRLWRLVRLVRHIFLSSHIVNGLACGFLGEIRWTFKKCIIWEHFPILELKKTDTYAKRSAVALCYSKSRPGLAPAARACEPA